MNAQTETREAGDVQLSRPQLSAEDRLARVVEASPTALVLVGRTGRIEMVNRQAERMFGYDRADVQDQALEILLPERFRNGHVALRTHFLSDMSSRMMGEGRELFGLRRDGSEFPLEIGLTPIDFDGEPMVLAGIIDVTSRHKAEQEKEQHRRELERSNADLDEFAHVASHDLKAPLRAIGHLAEWISEDIAPYASAETLENLALLKGRVSRLQQLLNGLLGYARVGNPQRPVEMVDVAEMVRDIVAITPPPQGFAVACQGPMGSVRTYRIPLRAVLENLISNALKHHDRATGRVDISMCRRGRLVEIRVADDGPGISPRFHERIFVIFQTLASRDEVETNGIGLAIVKKKVESHGGTVRVESQPPQRGTCFVFTWAEALE